MIGPSLAPAPVQRRRGRDIRWGLVLGLTLLAFLVLAAVAAPLITSADPTFESVAGLSATGEPLDVGAAGYPLGTDPKGRDLLARILYGGRLTLVAALASVAIATLAGVLVGLSAANTAGSRARCSCASPTSDSPSRDCCSRRPWRRSSGVASCH